MLLYIFARELVTLRYLMIDDQTLGRLVHSQWEREAASLPLTAASEIDILGAINVLRRSHSSQRQPRVTKKPGKRQSRIVGWAIRLPEIPLF